MPETAPYPYVIEFVLRGACFGLCILFAGRVARRAPLFGVENLAAVFSVGTAAYAVVSSPAAVALPGGLLLGLVGLATLNSVFFWWFATALFDDEFQWKPWRLAPFVFLAGLFIVRRWAPFAVDVAPYDEYLQQALIVALMIHVIWLALAHRKDDLVEPRRTFRLACAVLLGATGVIIAFAELLYLGRSPPVWLTTFHGFALFVLALGFASWVLKPIDVFAAPPPNTPEAPPPLGEGARVRLKAAMDKGAYKQQGLTLAMLADDIAYPEYKLRRLINQTLGFRNFNSFLNAYRVEDAKRLLADPENARMQITQVALGLGYGSVAPFNRAFKNSEGVTPSAYRKRQIGEVLDQ